jgi:UDP-N-acetylmuramyl pentapeptide phosphotransferase/UDP-N-acetylglucosamine-1-phosphate transferase
VSRAGRAVAAGATGVASAVAARAAYRALLRRPPAGEQTWARTNHRRELVTLLEGPAVAVGAITAEVLAAAVTGRRGQGQIPQSSERTVASRPWFALALTGGGALGFGVLDDLAGSGKRRGLKGHLGALRNGEVTTGTVKLAGLAATGLAGGVVLGGKRSDVIINAGLIAGGANLLNLFDLRPGRAIKVAVLSAGLIAAGGALTGPDRSAGVTAVAAPLGAGLALLPEDLGERAMLGDAGANALGAMLGAAAAQALNRPARAGLLAGIVALTVASEKISFTKVIENTPVLRRLDMLGRRPVPVGPAPADVATVVIPARPDADPLGTADVDTVVVAPPPGRRAGRHRRVESGASRDRSITRFFEFALRTSFLKTAVRQEP